MEPSKPQIPDATVTQENSQKSVRDVAKKRRKELLGIIKKIGIKNARDEVKAWAKHYEVDERSIYRDFKFIKKRYQPSEVEEIKIDLSVARDQALQQSLNILSKPENSDQEKLDAIKVLISASKHYREELEGWGEKPKIADKYEYEGEQVAFQLVEMSDREIKNEKEKHKRKLAENKEDNQDQQEANADHKSS